MSLFRLRYMRFPVMDMDISFSPKGFRINKITKIYNRNALPLPLVECSSGNMPYSFKQWYKRRMIDEGADMLSLRATLLAGGKTVTDNRGLLENASILSYGRNMTDKYWIAPVYKLELEIGKKEPLNGMVLRPRDSYKGLDFHKNGFATNYAQAMRKNSTEEALSHMDYNCPDICTNGKKMKRFIKNQNGIWLEKFPEKLHSLCVEHYEKAEAAHAEAPSVFPYAEPVMEGKRVYGTRTKLLSTSESEIVAFRDLCLWADDYDSGNDSCTLDMLEKAMFYMGEESLGMSLNAFLELVGKYVPKEKIYDNVGLLVKTKSREVIHPVAWV